MLQPLNYVLLEFFQALNATLLQANPIQIQEATLLVKQPVAELELVQVELTLQIKAFHKQIMLQLNNNVLLEFFQALNATLLQANPIQIQEATLLVKQPVAELELVQVELTLQIKA